MDGGLSNDVFYSVNGTQKAMFAGGFIFSELPHIRESELVTRVAAAIHYCKTVGATNAGSRIRLGVEYPLYTIVRSSDYLGDTFNDALLKGAILRSCGSQELFAVEDEKLQYQKKMIVGLLGDEKLCDTEKCFFFYELLLALKAFKLPSPVDDPAWRGIFDRL